MNRVLILILAIMPIQLIASFFNNNLLISQDKNIYYYAIGSILVLIILLYYIRKIFKKRKNITNFNKTYINSNYFLSSLTSEGLKNLSLNEHHKVFHSLKKADIYLNTMLDKSTNKLDKFNLHEFILKTYREIENSGCRFNISSSSNIATRVIANKELLENIFYLLMYHQAQEHRLEDCNTTISLNKEKTMLFINVLDLDYNKNIEQIFENIDNPVYNFDRNVYSGIYLYLLNRLLNKINGKAEIDTNKITYSIHIKLPIQIDKLENKLKLLLPVDKLDNIKVLIISKNDDIAKNIESYLASYNIVSRYISQKEASTVPNFLDYNILIADSDYLQSIVSDYLLNIKKHNDFKIVTLELNDEYVKYQNGLIDYTLKKPIIQSKIYNMILEFYSQACLDMDELSNSKKEKNYNLVNNRVLIADDSSVNRKLLKYTLESYSIDVVTVSNGLEALDLLNKDSNFNLVILDSIMPKLNAYEAIKEIRKNPKFNSIPVIIHTSFSYKHNVEEIFKFGFDSYLPKPFTTEQLRSILHRYLKVNNAKEYSKKSNREHLEEFLAIYANSGSILEKYIKQGKYSQAKSMLSDLKAMVLKIDKRELLETINEVEKYLELENVDSDLVYKLVKHIEFVKKDIQMELED